METRSNFYRYMMTKFDVIIPDEEPMKLGTANIVSFRIERDYDNLFFPIFQVMLRIDYPLYYKIVKNKNKVKFNVKLESYQYTPTREIKFRETVFDTTFTLYTEDNNYFTDENKLYKTMMNITDNQLTGGIIELYLFKEDDIDASRKVFNKVISSSTMTDAVVYMLSKSGINKVLMTPMQNTSTYNEILLLPTSVIMNMINLEHKYGFYKNGAVFFYDFSNVYLLSKTATANTFRTNEYTDVIVEIYKTNNNRHFTPGNYKDNITKTYTLHVNREHVSFATSSIVENETTGTDTTIVDGQSNTTKTVSPDVEVRGNKNTKTMVDTTGNKYLNTMIENKKIEDANKLSINIVDFDIAILTPNKKFSLSFEDKVAQKRYGGDYRLSSEVLLFTKEDEYAYSIEGVVTLKKPMK